MTIQVRAFQTSFIIHALLFLGVIAANIFLAPAKKTLVIDFSIDNQLNVPAKEQDTSAQERRTPVREVQQEQGKPKAEQIKADEPRAPISPVPEAQSPAAVPVLQKQSAAPLPDRAAARNDTRAIPVSGGVLSPANTGTDSRHAFSGNDLKNRYLKENFSYINDMIHKKAVYPRMARKMGWEGRVKVSFSILSNGSVSDVKIAQSSGIELLDKSAVEAVRSAAPFPKPPAEAELLVPIVYTLQ